MMTPWNARWAMLLVAGLGLTWAGCGGGDDIDPDAEVASGEPPSEAPAAPESAPPTPAPAELASAPTPPGPILAGPIPAAPDAAAIPAVPGAGPIPAAAPVPPAAEPELTASAPPSTKGGDPASATAEMLQLANAPAPPPTPLAPEAPAGSTPLAPGQPPDAAEPDLAGAAGQAGTGVAIEGGMAPLGAGGPGASGSVAAPGNFREPVGAVTAFLDALKARDKDALAEATALRSAKEASAKYQTLFASILERSTPDDQFDDLVKNFEGFSIAYQQAATKTGRIRIVLSKTVDGRPLTRAMEVRKEKAGWKVVDLSGYRDLTTSGSGIRRKK